MTEDGGQPLFAPKPPSKFHDISWRRARAFPTHEAMQSEVLDFLRTRPIAGLSTKSTFDRQIEGEYAFIRNGQVIGFADAFEILDIDFRRFVTAYEIKPKIDTVFGIVRQAKALLQLTRSSIKAEQHHCAIVVPHTDPLLAELRSHWPATWAWGFRNEDADT